jgi:hypothetical protein
MCDVTNALSLYMAESIATQEDGRVAVGALCVMGGWKARPRSTPLTPLTLLHQTKLYESESSDHSARKRAVHTKRQISMIENHLRALETTDSVYFDQCVKHYEDALRDSDRFERPALFRLCAMWFDEVMRGTRNVVSEAICRLIDTADLRKFLPLLPQFVARIDVEDSESGFMRTLRKLVTCLIKVCESCVYAYAYN